MHLLWCHVMRRAKGGECPRQVARGFKTFGETEIANQRFAPTVQQNVPRFQISMQDPLPMRVLHRTRYLRHQCHRAPWFIPQSRCRIQQTPATGKLHAEERQPIVAFAHFINRQNVRMIEARGSLCLTAETRQRFLGIGVIR